MPEAGPAAKTVSQPKCGKAFFIILNIIFLIMGLLVLAVGIYLRVMKSGYPITLLSGLNFYICTAILVTPGVLLLIVSLIGFCGIGKKGYAKMFAYAVLLVILMLIEGAGVVCSFMFKAQAQGMIEDLLMNGMTDPDVREAWDAVHRDLKCCGVHNYSDWHGEVDSPNPEAIPDSCCKAHLYNYPGCGEAGGYRSYDQGCYGMVKDWIIDNYTLVGGVGMGVVGVELILFILALLIGCIGKKKKSAADTSNSGESQNTNSS